MDRTIVKQPYSFVSLLIEFNTFVLFLYFIEQKKMIQDNIQKRENIIKMLIYYIIQQYRQSQRLCSTGFNTTIEYVHCLASEILN